jgi:eukaryotic-like serine/threonine-protein kinase
MTELSAAQLERANGLLDALLELPHEQRLSVLKRECADDPAVQAEVASLLRAVAESADFMSQPARPTVQMDIDHLQGADRRAGAWRLLRGIGHGGMGEVYEAQRVEGGFSQRAAIKLLRPESGAQLERFHAERQILARLEHPGIARLLDGGIADDGLPYMAMEFVEGRNITRYCAETGATLAQRLALFCQVCDAVAYAHRNLVVHRDLKPANILVDARDQVKLLDFGIAKLLHTAPDESHTQGGGAAPLTPMYAAPEQLTGAAVTTATDVYALGLLLFELLTDQRPWPEATTSVARALQVLRAKAAPTPSVAAAASAKPPIPPRQLRGDLDSIVAKALRAEPAHRYATVDALKGDIDRARRGEAVSAREGARLYAAGRLLRRYRWAAAAASAVFLALALGLSAAAWQAHRAAVERDLSRRDAAREEALRYQLTGLFRNAIADHGDQAPTAKSMLDKSAQRVLHEYRDQPKLAGQVVVTLADLYNALEDVQGSAALLEGFLGQAGADADPFAIADARQKLANIELLRGHVQRSGELLDQADAYWSHDAEPHAEERLENMGVRARWQRAKGDLEASIATLHSAITQRIALSGHDHRETATLLNSLAITLTSANRLQDALAAYKETSAIYDKLGIGDGLDAQIILGNTGTLALRTGRLHEAEALLEGAFRRERALAGDSAAVAASMGYYGRLLSITDRSEQAIPVLESAVEMATRYAGATSPLTLQNRLFLGEAQINTGNIAAARATLDADQRDALAHYGAAHPISLRTSLALARLARVQGQREAAREDLTAAVAALRKTGTLGQAPLAQALIELGDLELEAHHADVALPNLQEAVLLSSGVGEQSWELAQAREREGEALAAIGTTASISQARMLLAQAETSMRAQLGTTHSETLRAHRAIAALRP